MQRSTFALLLALLSVWLVASEVIYYSENSCGDSVIDPVIRSRSFTFCHYLKASRDCGEFTTPFTSRPHMLFKHCVGNSCTNNCSKEYAYCLIKNMFQYWEDYSNFFDIACIYPERMYFKRIHEEEAGSLCFWPLPVNSTYVNQAYCTPENQGSFGYHIDLPFTLSEEPFSCILFGDCNYIYEPLSFTCFNKTNDTAELAEIVKRIENGDIKVTKQYPHIEIATSGSVLQLVYGMHVFIFSIVILVFFLTQT